jgi:hypothetical protein
MEETIEVGGVALQSLAGPDIEHEDLVLSLPLRERERVCPPGEPTNAAPGSPKKILVLMERALRREPLFHPNDGPHRWKPIPGPADSPNSRC